MPEAHLTVAAALREGRRVLAAGSASDAEREARLLLAGVLATTPGRVALERDRALAVADLQTFRERLARRATGEPLQYIEGRAAFRELELHVDRSVLIPRPETEQLVEEVLRWSDRRTGLRALDLGTGSGAIAISLALEGPFERVVGVDISAAALNVARYNATDAGVEERIELREGSLFGAVHRDERFQVIVSNPPYVALAERESLPVEVRDWEPGVALYAGPTGVETIAAIVRDAPNHLGPGGLLALEVSPQIGDRACALVRETAAFAEPRLVEDLAGRARIILVEGLAG